MLNHITGKHTNSSVISRGTSKLNLFLLTDVETLSVMVEK